MQHNKCVHIKHAAITIILMDDINLERKKKELITKLYSNFMCAKLIYFIYGLGADAGWGFSTVESTFSGCTRFL